MVTLSAALDGFLSAECRWSGINRNALHLLDVHISSRELQARFGSLVDPLLQQVEVMQRRNKVLAGQRDLLLSLLISGEIDVSGLETPCA
ncbi:hypothetical protein WME95_44110 [Sorangium sp. So ce327]|uniref:hypothetical protein n=1 Tax=Sorangium sp. So ce327 TaxID=3133301 RepID=UPI003F5E8A67